jgi:penicillin V acylase-like amidase (Ntn superfamily)
MKRLYIFLFTLFLILHSVELFACTVFHVLDQKANVLVGRNLDWETKGGKVWFIPETEGKNSIAIFEQYGINMPYEGINNKGLFIGQAAVPNTPTPVSIFKPMRKSLEMIRIVLEQADTVDNALKIFPKYTVVFGKFLGHPQIHYKIVDANGNSAIVEYINNEIKVIKDSQVMTNHYISNQSIATESKTSFERYKTANHELKKPQNTISDIQDILHKVSQNSTVWSNVYDLSNQKIYVTYTGSETIILDLKHEIYLGKHGYNLQELKNKNALKYTEEKSEILFRPHFGYGSVEGNSVSHYGGRILLSTNNYQKYGLEVTQFDSDENEFTSIGIVLEQRLFNWFNMSIGTIGYFDYGVDSENLIGLTTNFGWEPDNHIPFKPFITYRNDVIFGQHTDSIHSISIGFNFEF